MNLPSKIAVEIVTTCPTLSSKNGPVTTILPGNSLARTYLNKDEMKERKPYLHIIFDSHRDKNF